ncbi:hypothetical protein MVEN_02354100 [Mycena venus]|uniref:Uncharacterized protein n=1 Tax=Mycena venus TaxID=2733690 RepID=A0A8H7CDB7_9AGAR|nr:hypothetical protein MVEN_02354100 [Mycena venus]
MTTVTPTGIVGVTTSGIQDVSGFLPLLGTEQCEEHVTNALERGFFYASGAPMSIFGSLGIIKAGFVTLWVSIDIPALFRGPRQMRNAGFYPKGVMAKLAYALDTTDSVYVAENKIRTILYRYEGVDIDVDLFCWPWLRWNLLMVLFGIGFGSLGLLPYLYIIRVDFRDRTFAQSWLFPVLRVYGSVLVATMIQLIIQLRILFVVHSRLKFHAVNCWFQEHRRVPPAFWNPEMRSEDCLLRLAKDIAHSVNATHDHPDYEYLRGIEKTGFGRGIMHPLSSFHKTLERRTTWPLSVFPSILLGIGRVLLLAGIAASGVGYVGCFGLVQASNTSSINGPGSWLGVEVVLSILRLMIWASNPTFDDPPPPIAFDKPRREQPRTDTAYEISWGLDDVILDDLHALVVGIDELIQPSESLKLKSAVKDAESVKNYLQNDLFVLENQITYLSNEKATSAGIIGALEKLATDNSIRPGSPIVIYMACHTVNRMANPTGNEEQAGMGGNEHGVGYRGPSLAPVAPIYLIGGTGGAGGVGFGVGAGGTGGSGQGARLTDSLTENAVVLNLTMNMQGSLLGSFFLPEPIPQPQHPPTFVTAEYKQDDDKTGLIYTTLVDYVHAIARRKGNNITVILDTCMAGSFGRNDTELTRTDLLISYPSHVLLAACSDRERARETVDGGVFTTALLDKLYAKAGTEDLTQLTYRRLVEMIRADSRVEKTSQQPMCSGIFQNRLLFNGLLARKKQVEASRNQSVILVSTDTKTAGWEKREHQLV